MASDIFHKVHDFAGEDLAHQLDHQLIKLGTDFDQVSDGFNDLIADQLKVDVGAHKHLAGVKYEDALIKHDVDTIGLDFVKLGDGFLKLDEVQHKFDDAFLKFSDQFIKFTSGTPGNLETDQGGIKLSDDFLKLVTDLKLTGDSTIKLGLDFLKLDHTHTESPNTALAALSSDFNSIKGHFGDLGDDFLKIGSDYKVAEINLGAIKLNESDALKIDAALHKLGTDDTAIGTDFHKLSSDLAQIATDIVDASHKDQPSESLSLNFSKIAVTYSEDFHKLDTDLHNLGLDLKLVGDDTIKLTGLLPAVQEPPGPVNDPGISDSLHQVLLLAQHFSLL
jgi:hypothetical protein